MVATFDFYSMNSRVIRKYIFLFWFSHKNSAIKNIELSCERKAFTGSAAGTERHGDLPQCSYGCASIYCSHIAHMELIYLFIWVEVNCEMKALTEGFILI